MGRLKRVEIPSGEVKCILCSAIFKGTENHPDLLEFSPCKMVGKSAVEFVREGDKGNLPWVIGLTKEVLVTKSYCDYNNT